MDIFEGQNLLEFSERFKTDENCKEYLSKIKWSSGYKCRKCNHTGSQERADYSRTCNRCSDTESTSVDTLFHRVRFGLRKAFFICFEITLLPRKNCRKLFFLESNKAISLFRK